MQQLQLLKQQLINEYLDEDLQFTIDRFPTKWSSGNGLMHTGFVITLFKKLSLLGELDVERFKKAVELCENGPGVYDRNKGRDDANAHDDTIGVCAGSVAGRLKKHRDVLLCGLKTCFIYDNEGETDFIDDLNPLKWEWWSFRLRMPFEILWYVNINFILTNLLPFSHIRLLMRNKTGYFALLDLMRWEALPKFKWFDKLYYKRERLERLEASSQEYFKSTNHPVVGLVKCLYKKR